MLSHLRPAAILLAVLTVLTGVVYPLVVTGAATVLFPSQAEGSLVRVDGRIVGSRRIGQAWDAPYYFQGRPSATSAMPYDGSASTGSNLGPSNQALRDAVAARVARLREENPGSRSLPIPVDLVTASGSGLDPEISPAAAYFQADRVARARGMPIDRVNALVRRTIEGRVLGILGEPRVNLLALNLALDRLDTGTTTR